MRVVAYENAGGMQQYKVQKNGIDFDLNAAGVTRIEVVEEGAAIDSDGDHVSFTGATISIAWGKLKAPGVTSPTIWAYSASYPEGEVIMGPGAVGSVVLNMMPDERPEK